MENFMHEIGSVLQTVVDHPLFGQGQNQITVGGLFSFLALCGVVVLGERILRRYLIMRVLRQTQMEPALQFAVGRFLGYAVLALGFFIALQVAGVNLSSLALVAGAVGVGLGFGLQNIISNFVSGLIILAERPVAIGDRVEVGGVAGQVRKISLRSTTVVTNDNIAIIVPNSDFITHSVVNWSHGDPKVRFRIPVSVAYGTDLEKLRRLLLEVAREHPKALAVPESRVYFISLGESAMNFELGVWTSDLTWNPRRFRSDLLFAIEKKLRDNDVVIPFPQRDVRLRSEDVAAAISAAVKRG